MNFTSIIFPKFNFAQTTINEPEKNTKVLYKVWGEIVNGDTVPSIRLTDVWIYAEYPFKNKNSTKHGREQNTM